MIGSAETYFEGCPVWSEIGSRIHLMFQNRELGPINLGPSFLQSRHGWHVEPCDQSHERIEIPNVKAFPGSLNPVLRDAGPGLLLLHFANLGGNKEGETIEPHDVGFQISCLFLLFPLPFRVFCKSLEIFSEFSTKVELLQRFQLGKCPHLNKFLRADMGKSLQLDVSQLLGKYSRTWTNGQDGRLYRKRNQSKSSRSRSLLRFWTYGCEWLWERGIHGETMKKVFVSFQSRESRQ